MKIFTGYWSRKRHPWKNSSRVGLTEQNIAALNLNNMTFKQIAYFFFSGLLIGLVIAYFVHRHFKESFVSTTTTTIIPGDTTPVISELPVPEITFRDTGSYHFIDTGSTRWKYHEVDTQAILKEYFYRQVYVRILKDDTGAFIKLTDTVTQNKLCRSKLEFVNRRPITLIENTIRSPTPTKTPFEVSSGVFVGRFEKRVGIGPVILVLKQNTAYSVNYDAINKDLYLSISKSIWRQRIRN